jgi:hypothetical protein
VIGATHSAVAQTAKKKKKSTAKKTSAAKVTSKSIIKWKKQGLSDDAIVERANDSGFKMTPIAKTSLKRARISKSLLAQLEGKPAATNVGREMTIPEEKPAAKKPVNLAQVGDPNDIDFDSVPPPKGIPEKYVHKDPPKRATIDRSTRPSAPFEETTVEAKPRADSKPKVADASPSGGSKQKRVVYTAPPAGN